MSKTEYYMKMAETAALRSSCLTRKVGAIVVVDDRIVVTGYNGTPRGLPNCDQGGCQRCADKPESGSNLFNCLCSHAEENCVAQAAYHGISLRDGTLYCYLSPCMTCAKLIINAGVWYVVYTKPYGDASSLDMLMRAGVRHVSLPQLEQRKWL